MRKIIGLIVLLIIGSMSAGCVMPDDRIDEATPYILCGHVYQDGELVEGVEVTLSNERTDEIQTFVTNSKGEYLVECLNFKKGYRDGDKITISCELDSITVIVNKEEFGIQADLNRPEDVDPFPVIEGTVLIAVITVGGTYYYIRKRKK